MPLLPSVTILPLQSSLSVLAFLPLGVTAPPARAQGSDATVQSAASSFHWDRRSAGYSFGWDGRDLTITNAATRKPVYSVAQALRREFGKPAPDDVFTYYEVAFAPLSLVGPYLSYQREDSWDGGAHPSGSERFVTVDARDPKRAVRLTDLFPPDVIRRALLADPIVRRVLQREKIAPPATLDGVLKALSGRFFGGEDDSKYSFPSNLMTDFAFHHVENGHVAVRFLLPHGSEIFRFQNTQMGILLPIPAGLKTAFIQAAAGKSGALMQTLQRPGRTHRASLVLRDRGAAAPR
jgi:hypothetical protein